MSTAPTLARSYEALRPKVLQRLLELRATLDPSLGRLGESVPGLDLALHDAVSRPGASGRGARYASSYR